MLAKTLSLLLLVVLAAPRAYAQNGCPDPQATNYSPGATTNDGSCQYATTTSALPLKTQLADAVAESSGLLYTGGKLWTLNDSGNTPELFRLDSATGRVVQQVRLTNAANIDWEDLAADARYVYVGDFGNNNGDRRNLRILRVAQADLGPAATTATAEEINFSYPDRRILRRVPTGTITTARRFFSPTTRCTCSPKTGLTCKPATTPCPPSPVPT